MSTSYQVRLLLFIWLFAYITHIFNIIDKKHLTNVINNVKNESIKCILRGQYGDNLYKMRR